jgi:hypothetical protein
MTQQWETDAGRWPDAILELRARVEALEAPQQQSEPIDEEENDRRFHACMELIRNATPEQIRAAAGLPERKTSKVYEINEPLQLTPEQAQQVRDLLAPNSKPIPNNRQIRSSLVERVQRSIDKAYEIDLGTEAEEARAAIREVAAHLKDCGDLSGFALGRWLEQEADR